MAWNFHRNGTLSKRRWMLYVARSASTYPPTIKWPTLRALAGALRQCAQTLIRAGRVTLQRQNPLMNRVDQPGGLREEQSLQLRRGRNPIPRPDHYGRPVQVVEAE